MNQSTPTTQRRGRLLAGSSAALLIALVAALILPSCLTTEGSVQESAAPVAPPAVAAADDAAAPTAPGPAALWVRNCARCHTLQPPARYSDADWGIVMHHMRLQCYLTGEEQRAIEQLMRSANN